MKKILLTVLALLSIAVAYDRVNAQSFTSGVTNQIVQIWKYTNGMIIPVNSTYTLGGPANPIAGGYFTNLFASTTSFTRAGGALDMGGYAISNGGTITGTSFVATSTTATTTLAGGLVVDTNTLVADFSTNRVGINNTSPSATLTVTNESADDSFKVEDSPSPDLTPFVIDASGNVGIGTTTPLNNVSLHVYKASQPFMVLDGNGTGQSFMSWRARTDSATNANAEFYFNSGGTFFINSQAYSSRGTSAGDTPRMVVVGSSGNVGIGTTTPNTKLTVASSGGNGLNIDTDTVAPTLSTRLYLSNATANQSLVMYNNAGNLVVATGGTAGSTSGTPRFNVNSTGTVGVATTTPWRTFSVVGTMAVNGLTSSTAGNAVCILSSFDIVNAGNTTCATSFGASKKDVSKLTVKESKDILMALKPVAFTYKESGDRRVGFIAEEVSKVDSRLVDYAKDDINYEALGVTVKKGEPVSVQYANITALLTGFVQDFYKDFQSLVAKVSGLEKRLNEQELRIQKLEKLLNNKNK